MKLIVLISKVTDYILANANKFNLFIVIFIPYYFIVILKLFKLYYFQFALFTVLGKSKNSQANLLPLAKFDWSI